MITKNSLNKIIGLICLFAVIGIAVISYLPPVAAADQVNLSVVFYYTSEPGRNAVQSLLNDYQKDHPNVKLNVQVVTQAKLPEVLKTRAIAKDFPDVSMITPQMVGTWASADLLQEGAKYIPKSDLKTFDPVRSLSSKYKGKIYGLPASSTVRAVAYNTEYFAKAGIIPPTKASEAWTWDQLITAAKKVQAVNGTKYAIQFEKPSFDGWMPFLFQAGGKLVNDAGTESAINSAKTRRALEWTAKLHKDGTAVPGIIEGTEDPLRTFASGLSTMWLGTGNWMMDALETQMKNKYSFTFLPKDAQQATVVGGTDWVVFKGKYPKEAWDLVVYMTGPKAMALYNTIHTSIPPRSDVTVNWAVKPELAPFFMEQSRMMPKSLAIQQLMPVYAISRDKLLQELSACVSGQQTVDKTLTSMDKIISDNLKRQQ